MKVEVIKTKNDELSYPYLGYFKSTGRVVLFTEKDTGVEIFGSYGTGHYSESWCESDAVPFQGEIVLSND